MSLIGVTRRVKHKNNDGTIIEAEIGAYARNVSEDEDHRFVTDKEKEEWSNKVNASGGDISNVKVSQFETNSTSWPVPTAGETVKVILGKIKKHLEDLASWRPTVSLIANIVDNCTSTNADKPLSAKQGKVLQDQITQVNSDMKLVTQTYHFSNTSLYVNIKFESDFGQVKLFIAQGPGLRFLNLVPENFSTILSKDGIETNTALIPDGVSNIDSIKEASGNRIKLYLAYQNTGEVVFLTPVKNVIVQNSSN